MNSRESSVVLLSARTGLANKLSMNTPNMVIATVYFIDLGVIAIPNPILLGHVMPRRL
jgi:hypothetical protein